MSEDPKDQLQFHQHNLIPDAGLHGRIVPEGQKASKVAKERARAGPKKRASKRIYRA